MTHWYIIPRFTLIRNRFFLGTGYSPLVTLVQNRLFMGTACSKGKGGPHHPGSETRILDGDILGFMGRPDHLAGLCGIFHGPEAGDAESREIR